MGRLGAPELIIILLIILVVFGAAKLPQIGGALGKSIREFRREASGEAEKKTAGTAIEASNNSHETVATTRVRKGF